MKYKRSKDSSKYISNSSEARKNRRATAIKKRSTALAAALMLMFTLTRLDILSRSGGIFKNELRSFSEKAESTDFIKFLRESIADFCFRYLRGEKEETKASVYAREAEEIKEESAIKSDAAAFLPEPAKEEKTFSPVMPCTGEISSAFGERVHPVSGAKSFHNGIDIALPEGSEIYACEDGRVTVAEYNQYSGNFIKIEHTDGYVSSYSHMRCINTEVGAVIKKGTAIGLAGSTGIATGPHLHFEILKSGEVLNPSALIGR